MKRILAKAAVAVLGLSGVLLVLGVPAGAELLHDTIGCSATATLTADDGTTVTVDATAKSVTIPRRDSAAWKGATNRVTHDQHGSVDVALGPFSVNLGRWGPTGNDQNQSTKDGVIDVPAILRQFPAVKWKLTGFHQGTEGRCEGEITVEVEGSTASTAAAGVAALAGTAAAAAGMLQAARPRWPGE